MGGGSRGVGGGGMDGFGRGVGPDVAEGMAEPFVQRVREVDGDVMMAAGYLSSISGKAEV